MMETLCSRTGRLAVLPEAAKLLKTHGHCAAPECETIIPGAMFGCRCACGECERATVARALSLALAAVKRGAIPNA